MIDITPGPIAFQLGPISFPWYGVCYAIGLALAALIITREARRRGLPTDVIANGMIVVAVAALIGGRPTTSSTSGRSTRTTCSRSSCRPTRASARTAA